MGILHSIFGREEPSDDSTPIPSEPSSEDDDDDDDDDDDIPAGLGWEPSDLCNISLEESAPSLRFQDGNVIIYLSRDDPLDTLCLHSDMLSEVSPRFRARFSRWGHDRVIERPRIGKRTEIFEYRLVFDGTYFLTDTKDSSQLPEYAPYNQADDQFSDDVSHSFYQSSLAPKIPRRQDDQLLERRNGRRKIQSRKIAVEEHKILFALVYNMRVSLPTCQPDRALVMLADLVAMAEYYDVLPHVAKAITKMALDITGLWRDVAEYPLFYISLARMLRSKELFEDSVRHWIGRYDIESNPPSIPGWPEAQEHMSITTLHLQRFVREDRLIRDLRRLGLPKYEAHADKIRRYRGPGTYETWLESTLGKKDLQQNCRYLAASIWREFLDFQLHGTSHWSHVRYIRSGKKDGHVRCGSLRSLCDQLMVNGVALPNIFGRGLISENVRYFRVAHAKGTVPGRLIADELKSIARQARHAIRAVYGHLYPVPIRYHDQEVDAEKSEDMSGGEENDDDDDDDEEEDDVEDGDDEDEVDAKSHSDTSSTSECCRWSRAGKPARHDWQLFYFTCLKINEDHMPWSLSRPWSQNFVEPRSTERASRKWLRAVGIDT